ncbi:hypothetical protein J2129_000172 [Methanofollis sp. W23]|nr:hypothetical protein [Methanofollis sp. W23]
MSHAYGMIIFVAGSFFFKNEEPVGTLFHRRPHLSSSWGVRGAFAPRCEIPGKMLRLRAARLIDVPSLMFVPGALPPDPRDHDENGKAE